MPVAMRASLEEVIWPHLKSKEMQALQGLSLIFPQEAVQKTHPLNFYSIHEGPHKIIVMPLDSLQFFGDLALACVWLSENGYSQDTVTEYLAMLKYQWPRKLDGQALRPLEVLGIPADAGDDPNVAGAYQEIFDTAVLFILAHELGHIYYQHRGYREISAAQARTQEEEADAFALEIMQRLGKAPVGVHLFFTMLAYLEPYAGDAGYLKYRIRSTHPVTFTRICTLLQAVAEASADFARTSPNPSKTKADLQKISLQLAVVLSFLDDKAVQDALRLKGLTTKPELLGPRRPGELMALARPHASHLRFDGAYAGEWLDAQGTAVPVEMVLNRCGAEVDGSYTFGSGQVSLAGFIKDERLYFQWRWGTQCSGNGVLCPDTAAGHLTGTWGYAASGNGGGHWKLRRRRQ